MNHDRPYSEDELFAPIDGPLDCEAARERLPLFVGGDLDAGDERAVEEHLGACEACRRIEREANRMRQVYFETASREPAVDLWPSVREALVGSGVLQGPAPRAASPATTPEPLLADPALAVPRRRGLAVGSLALAAVALVAVGLWSAEGRRAPSPSVRGELDSAPVVRLEAPDKAPTQPADAGSGLRPIPEAQRMLNGRPVILVDPNAIGRSAGPESLATDVRVR